jgi:hypothetical protein
MSYDINDFNDQSSDGDRLMSFISFMSYVGEA